MKWSLLLQSLLPAAVMVSCSSDHLITDRSFRNEILKDYSARSEKYASVRGDLFQIADTISENSRREALQFLLAYMPLSDIAVYEPEFLLANVDAAIMTRAEMEWGYSIPYDLFIHFVLPPRVNNENPDSFRILMNYELKERVKGLSAMAAALEINRWCHEKVVYQPSDIRTSSPMSTILSARGRCGEESTLTVAALRAVGLPARQVYTPRWAHSDDNHAWVEVWVNGQWHYMGACEPEMIPDRGWFTETARRAMLVHTRAFGRYTGSEPVVKREKLYSEINTLKKYAITKNLMVSVTDSTDTPVPGAAVSYLIYNYAEFYRLASLKSNENGECTLTTGLGSLLVWADDGSRYGFSYASPSDTSVKVVITSTHTDGMAEFDIIAPPVMTPFPGIDDKLVAENNRLLKKEDSIRQAYIDSWLNDINVAEISSATSVSEDRITSVLKASMGNYRNIASFISGAGINGEMAMRILGKISEKDLRDTPARILSDHLANAPENMGRWDDEFYDTWVLSPRIDNEILSPFRSSLKNLPTDLLKQFEDDPSAIAAWIDTAITITDTENYYGTPVIPSGVERLRMADPHSRDIFFVALARTTGHAARLEPGTGRPQYHLAGNWQTVWFTGESRPSDTPGYITFVTEENNPVPEYHIHFSLAVQEKGHYLSLDYGYNVRIGELPDSIPLDPGRYMLVTGNRDEKGNVLASLNFLELSPGQDLLLDVKLRKKEKDTLPGGKIDRSHTLSLYKGGEVNLEALAGKGAVFVWLDPGKEPTRHIINDLPLLKKEFDEWGGQFVFLVDPGIAYDTFTPEEITGLPEKSIFAADRDLEFLLSVMGGSLADHPLPAVICIDNDGNILFSSEGYRIGTGEQILKNINR